MSNDDFSDFEVDDIYYGVDANDEPERPVSVEENAESPATRGEKAQEAEVDEMDDTGGGASNNTAFKTLVQLAVILLLLSVDAAQLMGIAYRDTLDRRWTTSSADRVFAGLAAADKALLAEKGPNASALNLDANEAESNSGDKAAAPEPAPAAKPVVSNTPDPSAPPPMTGVAEKAATAEPPPAGSTTTSAATSTATPATTTAEAVKAVGTHAVAVGIFRSQRHVAQMKRDLEELSLPYFTRVTQKKGEGFVVRTKGAAADTLKAAKAALAEGGYDYKESDKGLAAYFHYEDEAVKALARVSSAGAAGAVEKITGQLPVWKLLAGPMSKTEAKAAAKKLSAAKIDNYLLRLTK